MPARPNLALPEYVYFQGGKHAELLDRLTTAKINTGFELASVMLIFWECGRLVFGGNGQPGVVVRKDVNVLQVYVAKILKETPSAGESQSSRNTYDVVVALFKEFEKALENYFADPLTDKKIVKFAEFQAEFRRFLRRQYEEGKRYKPERPLGGVEKPAEAARNET